MTSSVLERPIYQAPSSTPTRHHERFNNIGEGATPLMYACQQSRDQEVRHILASKDDAAHERDRTLKTALHYCAENVTQTCADLLLGVAAELLDAKDEDGYTALHLVVIAGNRVLIKFLLAKGADVNSLDNERHSVVHWATVCGEVEALEMVLEAGAASSTPDIHGGYPVHYAAQMCGPNSEMGNEVRFGLAVLRKLLTHGVDVTVTDQDGRQPILWAASADSSSSASCPSGSADAILALVNAGANVESEDKDGLTALHCAASRGHTDCLETLVSLCGAEVDVIDTNGCTALFYAVTLGHADSTQLLLTYGAEPNRQDRKGRTPSHCGAAKGQLETLRILGGHGGNLWLRNVKGDYPLHEAVSSGRKELVRWLLAQRPDAVNSPNNDGRCPLHIAAINNNVEMCKIILDGQALLNPVMRTSKGHLMTPMDAALHRSNRGCAKYLQLHGGVPANKLTDKTASIRGGSHREKLAMSETQSEQFTTPECLNTLPVPGSRGSLVSSPMGDVSDRTRTLQVRLSDDIAIRHVEKIEGPLLCRHYYDDDDSSEEERKQRRRRRRRKRNNLLEEDVRRRWQRNIYSDKDSDEKKEEGLRRKWRTGHLSDRDNDGDTSRMKHLSETNQRISHSEESEDYEDKEESDYEQVQNENKHNNIRNTFKDNSEVGNTSNVEYVTVKKTTIKTKKTRVKSKTDEEEVKETQQESDNNKKGKEKIARLEVEDSTIERSESREREVIKRTVKSSVVKEKKQKEKPKLKEEINKTKVNINKEIKVKGKTEKNKNTIQSKNSSDKINNTNTKKYKGSANTKDCLENNSLSQTPSEDTKDQTKQKEHQTMESSSSNDKLVGSTSFEEEHIKSQTPSLDEENNGKLTQTIVTAIVHQQDIAEDPFNIQEQEENSLRVQKESDDAKIVLENENDKIEETDDISALFGGEYDKEDKTEVKEEKRKNEQLFENSIGEMKGDEEAIEKEQITFEEESNESTCNIEHFESIKSDSTTEMLKVEINNETILDGDENCNEQKNNSYISKSDDDEADKYQHEHVSIEEFETELSENKREHVITTEGEENHDNCGTETNDPNLQEDENEVKPDIDDDYENTTKISDEIKGRSSEDYSKAEVAETSEQTESVAQTGDEAQELEKDEDTEVTSILNKDKETWVETAHTTATSSPTGRDDEEEIDESGASTGHSRNEDSSILLDSGFEPSPRHDKEKKPDKIRTGSLGTGRGRSKSGRVQRPCRSGLEDSRPPINTSSVTRSVQNSMRKYHLERRIFQELLELKRLQIRAGRANEQVLVKRLVDDYQKAGLDIGLQKYEGPFTFRNFEKYLYEQLRLLQTSDRRLVPRLRSSDDLEKLSVVLRKARLNNKILNDVPDNPILCTHGTHRCHHAAHAYTGIPCAAYITKLNHHHVAKGTSRTGFLPRIDSATKTPILPRSLRYVDPSRPVTLELTHGADKQVISLPTEQLDKNKRYYVTFTIKGGEEKRGQGGEDIGHRQAKSL